MKVELVKITEEMTDSKDLTEALNKNFEALNDRVQEREDAIIRGLKEMEGRIIKSFNESMDIKMKSIEKRLSRIEKHFGINPNLLTEDDK